MAASDYMVGNAPAGASYAAPLVGQFLGQQFEKMPQEYFEGQQRARTTNIQKPILGPDGQPTTDPQAIMKEMLQRGGGEYAEKLIPFMMQMQADQPLTNVLSGNPGGQPGAQAPQGASTGPGAARSAAGPGNVTARPQASAPAQPGPPSAPATQVQDQPTVMKILAAQGIPNDQLGAASASIARQLGVSPTDPIDPRDPQISNVLGPALAQLKRMNVGAVAQPGQQPGAPPQPGAQPGAPAPGAQPSAPQPGSTAPMVPRQVQTQPVTAPAAAPAQGAPPAPISGQPQASSDQTLGGLVPSSWIEQGRSPEQYRDVLAALASRPGISANAQAVALARIKAIDDRMSASAKSTQDFELAQKTMTPEQKNARDPTVADFELTKERDKLDAKRFSEQGQGISAAAGAADSILPHLQLARSLMAQPNFYSGAGEGTNLAYKRALAAFGGDPNAALPQEAFRKVMAATIQDQIANLKAETAASGAGSGRIFQAQIELMEKAAQNPDNSVASNRLLTEIGFRSAQRAKQIADMADQYGPLDRKFNVQLRKWNDEHPMFTPAELKDPRLIAAPTFNTPQEVHAAGLPHGFPFKTPNGDVRYIP